MYVSHNYSMELNVYNPIEDIYLNTFSLGQSTELQIMATWVRLSSYLLFVRNLSPFKFAM